MNKLSVVLAVFNEEENLSKCLKSIKDIADEIVIIDGGSTDNTVSIAESFSAKIIETDNPKIFHINKQKALEQAKFDWILQLDADEVVTQDLSDEIIRIINMPDVELEGYQEKLLSKKIFHRHQALIDKRDGGVGDKEGEFNAFFIPRRNYFLGKYLKYGGTYPDPAIRLIRKGKAYFPAKDVHEQMVVKGRVGWLQNYMLHNDSPTFRRYIQRNNRYINLIVDELRRDKVGKNIIEFIRYFLVKPFWWFMLTQFRHKGILDGWQGIVFSFFSSLRFPRAYFKYLLS